jgi:B-cell receptor-associated protein 31
MSRVDSIGGAVRSEVQARKFYSQRNMYLCGFTLFLSLILNRTYVMILDVLRLEEEVKRLSGDPKATTVLSKTGELGEVAKLKQELANADAKVKAMEKQTQGLQREYDRLGDEKTGVVDGPSKKDK